ncbi:phosphoribosyltransferase family protein [Streptomyces sp. NBC_01190]|uniref:phosphoribosyltransferase family protein n=1 Tax=Streptomyces sp. NBC_01190 TaxID=2903767 RepID=UPI003863898F|nr:phosphoribosyltransferase family protein [Streptomyces sp. NBC_01190]
MVYRDRQDAGRRLAGALRTLRDENPLVLALPRGGVPVAEEVARALDAPMDVCLVRKLGVPFRPELAMGAVGEGGARVVNDEVVRATGVSPAELADVEARERAVLEQRAGTYRQGRPPADLAGRTVILVDDGIATGATGRAAAQVARARGAARIVLAAPVAPPGWTDRLLDAADTYVCLSTPPQFTAVGQFYTDFSEVGDAEVIATLAAAADRAAGPTDPARPTDQAHPTGPTESAPATPPRHGVLPAGSLHLPYVLTLPPQAPAVVVFAHGTGSDHRSVRNRSVARALNDIGLGTLLLDLLAPGESPLAGADAALLAGRVAAAVRWLREQPDTQGLSIGCFGASTGAGAALWAATEPGTDIAAIVCRGGRPDLAESRLDQVTAPTLLIVGSHDATVVDLNRQAQTRLHCPNDLALVPGAGHLFEEPGAMDAVARLTRDWFAQWLGGAATPGS